jgi:sugar lactone lactonase YvrE
MVLAGLSGGIQVQEGWSLDHACRPHPLHDANGIRFGPDGLLYITHLFGSAISGIDVDTGAVQQIRQAGYQIVAPDDLDFDGAGVMYTTGPMKNEVCARAPDGSVRVLSDAVPGANGITVHGDRIFVDECRDGGRLLAFSTRGGEPDVLADRLPFPNALAVGPDGNLYFPCVVPGEVWRIPVDGGTAERFVTGLSRPTSIKFDAGNGLIVTQAGSGEVTRVDLRTRATRALARLDVGLDNCALAGDGRLFCSNYMDGSIREIDSQGRVRQVIEAGFIGPLGLAVSRDGRLLAADWWSVKAVGMSGVVTTVATRFDAGFPGMVRAIAAGDDGRVLLSTSRGTVSWFDPATSQSTVVMGDLDEAMGVACTATGDVFVAEAGAGRVLRGTAGGGAVAVLASGLDRPTGVAACDGVCYVTEAGAGRVVRVSDAGTETVVSGMQRPEGLALSDGALFIVDVGAGSLLRYELTTEVIEVLASGLPVGSSPATARAGLPGIAGMIEGPLAPFAGVTATPEGVIFVAGDREGSILRLRRSRDRSADEVQR